MISTVRRPIVGVMGSGTREHLPVSTEVGQLLARLGVHLLTGGGAGVMSAVSRAFAECQARQGCVIGILPCREHDPQCRAKEGYPNPWVEIPIHTHLPLSGKQGTDPMSRNHINILTSDAVIALPGGPGTASEISLAIRYNKPIIAYLGPAETLPGLDAAVPATRSLGEVENFLRSKLAMTNL